MSRKCRKEKIGALLKKSGQKKKEPHLIDVFIQFAVLPARTDESWADEVFKVTLKVQMRHVSIHRVNSSTVDLMQSLKTGFLFVFLISKNSLYILLYTSVWEHVDSCNIIYDAYLEFHATSFPWRERTASCHSNPRNIFILQCRVLNNTAILNRRQRPCSYEQDTRYLSRVGEM